ncbi:MAG: tRNA lysidine(34) synthetase TilS [Deltaproteobacteria bacterium]|nr:tRNA lysidine(34) synthetase TilS [Deltaproteobacteria bacterium]
MNPSDHQAFLSRFRAELISADSRWESSGHVLGLSGGRDSMALAGLLQETCPPERVVCAVIDHGIRKGSADEAELAAERARALGFRAVVCAADVPAAALARGKGLEEAGRAARYAFLEEVRMMHGFRWVLTAHHAGDNAETILMKIARGAGPGALMGIPFRQGRLIRPLLRFTRPQLQEYLEFRGLRWVDDPTNLDWRVPRNRVRLRVMPELAALNPRFAEAAVRGSELCAAEEDFWRARLEILERGLVAPAGPRPPAGRAKSGKARRSPEDGGGAGVGQGPPDGSPPDAAAGTARDAGSGASSDGEGGTARDGGSGTSPDGAGGKDMGRGPGKARGAEEVFGRGGGGSFTDADAGSVPDAARGTFSSGRASGASEARSQVEGRRGGSPPGGSGTSGLDAQAVTGPAAAVRGSAPPAGTGGGAPPVPDPLRRIARDPEPPPTMESGPFAVDLAGFLALHLAERRRLLGRLLRRIRLPGPSGGEPAQFMSVEKALDFVKSGDAGGIDLPGGRRVERRGSSLYIGPASRYVPSRRGPTR